MTAVERWHERPRDEANLFNPVFLALLIGRVATGHREKLGRGVPWPLAFLALPVVLHKRTRDQLPPNVNTSMAAWTRRHPLLTAAVGSHAQALRPLISDGLLFGL